MEPLFLLVLILGVFALCAYQRSKPFHISMKGVPYIERDADGYITPDSYRSHIKYWANGRVEVDIGVLIQTRNFHDSIVGMRSLRQFIQSQKKS